MKASNKPTVARPKQSSRRCAAFAGARCIASGDLRDVVRKTRKAIDKAPRAPVLIFDDASGEPIEIDFRGSSRDVLKRLAASPHDDAAPDGRAGSQTTLPSAGAGAAGMGGAGPGRPKLGVVGREVTLLPRHWDWLNSQPGGASVALRKLVEHARLANRGRDRVRRAQEVAYRVMAALAGNLPNFEEAARALFAADRPRFDQWTHPWPPDIRAYCRRLATDAFGGGDAPHQERR